MSEKFLGMGLKKGLSLGFFVIIMIVVLKVVANKYPVKGFTEIINTV